MVYIIISNIGLAIMMIYIYSRYSHFRITSAKEIKELRLKNETQSNELRDFDAKLLSSVKSYQDRVESLLIEVGKVRQEKEKEMELRSQVEKKFEVLYQKNADYELIHNEITGAILNIVNDTHETARNLEKGLYEKINDANKKEAQENQKLISKINQNVADFVEKFNLSQTKATNKDKEDNNFLELTQNNNKYISETVDNLEKKNFVINETYFLLENFHNHKLKKIICEIVFVKDNKLYILDFKAINYISEYYALKAKNDVDADNIFDISFKRYIEVLGNDRYYNIINELLGSFNINHNSYQVIIIVPSLSEIKLLKDLKYYDRMRQLGIEVFDVKNFIKIL